MNSVRDPQGLSFGEVIDMSTGEMIGHLSSKGITIMFDIGSVRLHVLYVDNLEVKVKRIWKPTLLECMESYVNDEWEK